MKLLNSQKNILFELIEACKLYPSQFELEEIMHLDGNFTKITFKNSDYYFKIDSNNFMNSIIYSPADSKFVHSEEWDSWDYTIALFEDWLHYLNREINITDKWQRLQKEMDGVKINIVNDNNNSFSAYEYEELKKNMIVLKQGISSIGLLPDQMKILNDKLEYLTELAVDMNKFDWKNLFIGTILSIISSLAFSPENSKSLWLLIKQVFNNYFLP